MYLVCSHFCGGCECVLESGLGMNTAVAPSISPFLLTLRDANIQPRQIDGSSIAYLQPARAPFSAPRAAFSTPRAAFATRVSSSLCSSCEDKIQTGLRGSPAMTASGLSYRPSAIRTSGTLASHRPPDYLHCCPLLHLPRLSNHPDTQFPAPPAAGLRAIPQLHFSNPSPPLQALDEAHPPLHPEIPPAQSPLSIRTPRNEFPPLFGNLA